jgi:hypothetical protein
MAEINAGISEITFVEQYERSQTELVAVASKIIEMAGVDDEGLVPYGGGNLNLYHQVSRATPLDELDDTFKDQLLDGKASAQISPETVQPVAQVSLIWEIDDPDSQPSADRTKVRAINAIVEDRQAGTRLSTYLPIITSEQWADSVSPTDAALARAATRMKTIETLGGLFSQMHAEELRIQQDSGLFA